MVTCPHCDQKAISWQRKMSMGIAREITCPNCGKKLALSWLAWFNLIPYCFTIFWIFDHTRGWGMWLLIAIALFAVSLIQIFGIPLVKSRKS